MVMVINHLPTGDIVLQVGVGQRSNTNYVIQYYSQSQQDQAPQNENLLEFGRVIWKFLGYGYRKSRQSQENNL